MTATPQLSAARPERALRLRSILVPTDFSEESFKALSYALAFAREFNAALWIAHVVEPAYPSPGIDAMLTIPDEQPLLETAEKRLAKIVAEQVPTEIDSHTFVTIGTAYESIVSTARDRDIDLIIASTHGRTGINRVLFGSTAERIVHHAPCPLLLVRQREHEFLTSIAQSKTEPTIQLKRILVPIDFSECSRKALHYAKALAAQWHAEVVPVHAFESMYVTGGEPGLIVTTEKFQAELAEQTRKRLTTFLAQEGLEDSAHVLRMGTPYREILDLAENSAADLIVLGTHGHSAVHRFLLGSTTERIVRHARCPVLVVRERERDFIENENTLSHRRRSPEYQGGLP
jgi:nucleotide-binding universal stress UspA family protein